MTQLENAKNKLNRLKGEQDGLMKAIRREHDKIPFGQHAQNLIDNGLVTQWKKKPIYYFVKGLRKVAVVLNDLGDFEISKEYSPDSDSDIEFVEKLLKK